MNIIQAYHCEIIAQETPRIIHNCRRCNRAAEFYCSEKFRVNAQQKNIDVWLIYKCLHCDSTWNYPVVSRMHCDAMDQELHERFMLNDRETAWEYAFQLAQLRKQCSGVITDIRYTIDCEPVRLDKGAVQVALVSRYRLELRLDKILKELLGVSRAQLYHMEECGRIVTRPHTGIKSKMKEDLEITVIPC
jgi:hypothetical protein